MAFDQLPTEVLDIIIPYAMPEGFQSLAVTCKEIYTLCVPLFPRYNELYKRFHHFSYHLAFRDRYPMVTAVELIKRIACEPIVASYIQSANLKMDSPRSYIRMGAFSRDTHRNMTRVTNCGEDVVRLFAESKYLTQAGLDWKEYIDKIEEELDPDTPIQRSAEYSQHAATFVLTLLPNAKTVILPSFWKSPEASAKLIDAIIDRSKQSNSFDYRPSLGQLIEFEPLTSLSPEGYYDLALAVPFLGLPRIQSFKGTSCVVMSETSLKSIKYNDFGATLESITLVCSCLDEVAILDFLRNAKCLKTLKYSHSIKRDYGPRCWNVCKFIAAVQCQVGSHLISLSVSIRELFGSIAPGKVSMREFPCLQELEFPLEIVTCNMAAAACASSIFEDSLDARSSDHDLSGDFLFIGDLVPASVSILSVFSDGKDHHDKALEVMFRDFSSRTATILPALKKIDLDCPREADVGYKDRCTKLLVENSQTDVDIHLTRTW